MDVKIIALDLDGTLMMPDHLTVSSANREALKKAHNKGIKIAISTGRTLSIMWDVCQQVPEVDYVMYSNGAGVLDRKSGENIFSSCIPNNICNKIMEQIGNLPVFVEIYIQGNSYAQENKKEHFIYDFLPDEVSKILLNTINMCDNLFDEIQNKNIEKITVYCKYENVFNDIWNYLSTMSDEITIASSIKGNIDITKAGVDKGVALKGMCEALGFTKQQAMAFGDGGNDCPMLEYAQHSFAMENADECCKASAKHITKSNAEDGVAWAINKYVLE